MILVTFLTINISYTHNENTGVILMDMWYAYGIQYVSQDRSENHFLAKLSRSLMSNANQGKHLVRLVKIY